jgi:hypothetical protein
LEDYIGIMGGIQSGRIAAGALADPFTDHPKYKESPISPRRGWSFRLSGL